MLPKSNVVKVYNISGFTNLKKYAILRIKNWVFKLKGERRKEQMKWEPEGLVCLRCGASNPDRGDRCGNCEEDPFTRPGLLTREQMTILRANKLRRKAGAKKTR